MSNSGDIQDKLLNRCMRHIRKHQPSCADGMAWVCEQIEAAVGPGWNHAKSADWNTASQRYTAWFLQHFEREPLPDTIEAFWFETPSDLNPAGSLAQGFEKLGPKQMSYGLDEGSIWPMDDDFARADTLDTLEAVIQASGFRDAKGIEREELGIGECALSSSFITLAAMEAALAADLPRRVKHRSGVALITGYAAGDAVPILQLRPSGWAPVRRVRMPSKEHWEEIAWYPGLDVAGYLRAGCDANIRGHLGKTLLMDHAMFLTPKQVDLLIEAGADVHAKDDSEQSVLHHCSGARPDTVDRLIHHGADVNATTDFGYSVLHALSWNDKDTELIRLLLKHGADATVTYNPDEPYSTLDRAADYVVEPEVIHMLLDAGAQFIATTKGGSNPLHVLASCGVFQKEHRENIPQLITLYKELGFDINARNDEGDTPLWVALNKHAKELSERLGFLQTHMDLGGSWDYNHDWVAIELLKQGANPNATQDKEQRFVPAGATPLMIRRYDDTRLVKALMKHGADPFRTDASGRNALDHAREAAGEKLKYGREACTEVIQTLEDAMK